MYNDYKEALTASITECMVSQVKSVIQLAGLQYKDEQVETLAVLLVESGVVDIVVDSIYAEAKKIEGFVENEQLLLQQMNLSRINNDILSIMLSTLHDEKIVKGLSEVSLQIMQYLGGGN